MSINNAEVIQGVAMIIAHSKTRCVKRKVQMFFDYVGAEKRLASKVQAILLNRGMCSSEKLERIKKL